MKHKIIIVLIIFLSNYIAQAQIISGSIIDSSMECNNSVPYATIHLINTDKVVWGGHTDEFGNFKIENVEKGIYTIRVLTVFTDTFYKEIAIDGNKILKLNIHKFYYYAQYINNNVCPICFKKDRVIPIIYGTIIIKTGKYKCYTEGKRYLSGGDDITTCIPHWYCKRNRIKF